MHRTRNGASALSGPKLGRTGLKWSTIIEGACRAPTANTLWRSPRGGIPSAPGLSAGGLAQAIGVPANQSRTSFTRGRTCQPTPQFGLANSSPSTRAFSLNLRPLTPCRGPKASTALEPAPPIESDDGAAVRSRERAPASVLKRTGSPPGLSRVRPNPDFSFSAARLSGSRRAPRPQQRLDRPPSPCP